MSRMKIFFLLTCLFLTTPAYAYIDPGTGSFLIQGLVATFFSATFAIKMYWQRVKKYFSKNKASDPIENNVKDPDAEN